MIDLARYEEIRPAPRAVFDRLEERATRVRYMVPEGSDYRAVTYESYAAQIEALSLFLASVGFEPGERAAVFAQNSVEWMTAAMATQAVGGVLVPIYPASTPAQAAYVARHSGARVLFVDGDELLARVLEAWGEHDRVRTIVLLPRVGELSAALGAVRDRGKTPPPAEEVDARSVRYGDAVARGRERAKAAPRVFADRLASVRTDMPGLMLYTSGTTGNPKGVPLTHANVGHNGLDWMRCFAPLLDEGYTDVLWLPMSHIFGFGEACIGDSLGWTTTLAEPADALSRLARVRPDVFFSVPAYWEKLASAALAEPSPEAQRAALAARTGGRLKFCLSGGAGLKRAVKELFHRHGWLILEGYGLTECSPTLTLNRPSDFRFDSVGKPLPSLELRLAEDGEILARGPNVFRGYHEDPEATRQAFTEDGWFKTGDVGRFTEDGFLQIVDRKKEILVTAGGKNVPPANIEVRFADEPLVSHAVVYGDGRKYLVAGLWLDADACAARLEADGVPSGERDAALQRLVAAAVARVNGELARFEQIARFKVMGTPLTVAGGLLTSTLKVRRKQVYETFARDFEALYEGG